jgi:tRNA G18 (ribose-2'-O)-methylase SpoU
LSEKAIMGNESCDHRRETYVLTTGELRRSKLNRSEFAKPVRNPIALILDGVRQNYNLGAIFRLCDGFSVERLVICGTPVALHKRKLVQAAAGTQHWVPWETAIDGAAAVRAAKAAGYWVAAVELTTASLPIEVMQPQFPAALLLGGESSGVSCEALAYADQAVAIPMLGMANSLNVATAAAIALYDLVRRRGQWADEGTFAG